LPKVKFRTISQPCEKVNLSIQYDSTGRPMPDGDPRVFGFPAASLPRRRFDREIGVQAIDYKILSGAGRAPKKILP
jgi:hypothetical protein